MSPLATQHSQKVKAFFEAPRGYFGRRGFDIRIRTETVGSLTRDRTFGNVLDIGCGNGEISLPLLDVCSHLTLNDVSETMLALATSRVRSEHRARVALVNAEFMSVSMERRFDLIVCVGVLAHVEDPAAFIARIASLLNPGGELIVEVTDGYHPVGRALRLYHRVLGWVRPVAYPLNRLRIDAVARLCRDRGLAPKATYRYALPPPGSQRLFAHDTLYRMVRWAFGDVADNRRAWLGNVAISSFLKP